MPLVVPQTSAVKLAFNISVSHTTAIGFSYQPLNTTASRLRIHIIHTTTVKVSYLTVSHQKLSYGI
jgi:hypothetical protein